MKALSTASCWPVGVDDIVRVRMAAKPLVCFEQDDVVCASEQVCSGETGDPAPTTATDGRRPNVVLLFVRGSIAKLPSKVCLGNARFHRVVLSNVCL
jgi:hypothetical protein